MRIARTKALEFPATVSKRHGRTARTDAWFTDRELMRRKLAVSVAGLGPQDRWDRTPALPSPPTSAS